MWKKDGRVAHATDYNIGHAHCMLHTYSYIYTQNYIIIAFLRQGWLRERAFVTSYVACLISAAPQSNKKCHAIVTSLATLHLSRNTN